MSTVEDLKQQIHEDLEELRAGLLQFVRAADGAADSEQALIDQAGRARLEAGINDAHESVEAMGGSGEAAHQAALQALSALGALSAQLDYYDARAALPTVAQAVASAWAGLGPYLKTILGKVSSQLWQLVARLLKLKEWSVTGSAGVALFGLAGNAQIQLTFA